MLNVLIKQEICKFSVCCSGYILFFFHKVLVKGCVQFRKKGYYSCLTPNRSDKVTAELHRMQKLI